MRVHLLLFHAPLVLSFLLLVGQHLIIGLHFFKLLLFFDRHVVLKHASHSGHVVGLGGVLRLFNDLVVGDEFLLASLLFHPFLLDALVGLLALSVG